MESAPSSQTQLPPPQPPQQPSPPQPQAGSQASPFSSTTTTTTTSSSSSSSSSSAAAATAAAPSATTTPPAPPTRDRQKPPVRGKTSPYGFFVKMCYEEHKKKFPNETVQVNEISKKCSEKWQIMRDEEKRRFYELAQKDAERYQAEVAAYGSEETIKKKKRVKKDPNAPKRALSAFFFFSQERRLEIQSKHLDWKVLQVAQELGRMWKEMSQDERDIYEKLAIADKKRYAEEMEKWKNSPTYLAQHAQYDSRGLSPGLMEQSYIKEEEYEVDSEPPLVVPKYEREKNCLYQLPVEHQNFQQQPQHLLNSIDAIWAEK